MDSFWESEETTEKMPPETIAVGLADLTRDIDNDDDAFGVMLMVVTIAMELRYKARTIWN